MLWRVVKSIRLIAGGNASLLAAMLWYRAWWRLRGLNFGTATHAELGLDPARASFHKDGGGPQLRRALERLGVEEGEVVLDLGAGKGGAMATMARFPFARIDGVELKAELVEVARANFERLGLRQCRVFEGDAAELAELDDYDVLFMFHAFSTDVLERVLANLVASLERRPRRVRIVYENPLEEPVILATGQFHRVLDYHPYEEFRICTYETSSQVTALS